MKDLGKIQRRVLQVITFYPEAANDDAALLSNYWLMYDGWDDSKSLYWNLSRSTRAETISRRRRELFNLGLIQYSETKDKERMDAYKNERDHKAVSWLND